MSAPTRRSSVATAQKKEAVEEGPSNVSFQFEGKTYTTVAADHNDPALYDLFEAVEESKILTAVKLLLDGDSYLLFRKGKPSPTKGWDILQAGMKALGADTGE